MINKHNIALAENIAVGIPTGLVVKVSPIVAALDAESFGAFEYTENFREQIVDVTANTQHSAMVDLASTQLAESIRGAFDMVKTYGVPLAQAIGKGLRVVYSPNELQGLALNNLEVGFINIDDPFFDSPVYPTEDLVKNKALSFSSVGLEVLKKLRFEYTETAKLREFVATTHPDINAILDSKESDLSSISWMLGDRDALSDLFYAQGDVFDFTRVKSVRTNLLLKMWVLLSRMNMTETTVPWLSEGSREDYRTAVELLWNGLTVYLINLKKIAAHYRARKVVLTTEGVGLMDWTPPDTNVTVKLLKGKATLYYTDEAMRLAEQAGNSLLECVVASVYGNAVGKAYGLLDLVGDKAATTTATSEYYASVHNTMDAKAREVFVNTALTAVSKFIVERDAAKQALFESTGDTNTSVMTLVHDNLANDVDKLFFLYTAALKEEGGLIAGGNSIGLEEDPHEARCTDVVLKTDLVPKFLRLLGCHLAAEVIELTFVKQEAEDNLTDKRERLHAALIEMLAGKLIG